MGSFAVLPVQERVLADQARRKSESLAHVGAWEWDIAADEITFSDEWAKIHGCTDHRVSHSDVLRLVHPDDRSQLEQQCEDVIHGKLTQYETEYRIARRNDGQERILISRALRVEDGQGRTARVLGCDQDVTELERVEQDLHASKKHLQSENDVVGQAIISIRFPERIIEGVNRRVEELLGYSPQELAGRGACPGPP